jgi:hypothetical protein
VKCAVCHVTFSDEEARCPQCGYDARAPGAGDPRAILAARNAFREKTTAYAPGARVRRWDRIQPWVAVALGFAIFVFWMRACSSGGFSIW